MPEKVVTPEAPVVVPLTNESELSPVEVPVPVPGPISSSVPVVDSVWAAPGVGKSSKLRRNCRARHCQYLTVRLSAQVGDFSTPPRRVA